MLQVALEMPVRLSPALAAPPAPLLPQHTAPVAARPAAGAPPAAVAVLTVPAGNHTILSK
jgi:hypothetical protein